MHPTIEYFTKKNEEFEGIPFPPSIVQPGLEMTPKRILELYSVGVPVNVALYGEYDDIQDNDSDFDFSVPEDEFDILQYSLDNDPEEVKKRLEQRKIDKVEPDPEPEPKPEEKSPENVIKGAE